MPDAERVTLEQIYDALVQGYNGAKIAGTRFTLGCGHKPDSIDDVSDEKLPYLLFDIGTLNMSDWKSWEKYTTWNIQAKLKVKGEPGDVDKTFLRVLMGVFLRTNQILGLPVDDAGNIVPYSQSTAFRFDHDQLTFLADRGAPLLTSVQTLPGDGKYLTANIAFSVQCVLDLDPRTLPIAKVGIMDVQALAGGLMSADSTLPESVGIPLYSTDDEHGVTLGYDTASPVAGAPGQGVAGTPPSKQIESLVASVAGSATPYALSLSVGTPTGTLQAIAYYQNSGSQYVTPTWSSSNTAVATVNSSGVVTRVAAGSCTVSCTFGGVTSNAVAVTCS